MRRILLVLACGASAFGAQSLRVTGSGILHYIGALTSSTEQMRWEGRIHGFGNTCPNSSYGAFVGGQPFNGGTVGNNEFYAGGGVLGAIYTDVLTPSYGHFYGICDYVPPIGTGDLVWREQRIPGSMLWTIEMCWTEGGICTYNTLPISTLGTTGTPVYMGVGSGTTMAFLRWFPNTVTAGLSGTGLINSISVAPPGTPSALLGDWEMEGNLSDSSTNAGPLVPYGSPTVAYVVTPVYAPACSAGTQQSVRAGSTMTLAGSCTPLDGNTTCNALWQSTPGGVANAPYPTPLWTGSQKSLTATLVPPTFGSYNFTLSCTDSSQQTSTSTIHDGAVATDSNGVVIYPPGHPYDYMNQLLGPLIQWGKNSWPQYDLSNKQMADYVPTAYGPPMSNGIATSVLAASMGASDTTATVASSDYPSSGNSWCQVGTAGIIDQEQILYGGQIDATHCAIYQRGYRGTTAATHASGAVTYQYWYWDWWNWDQGPGSGTCTVTSGGTTFTCTGAHFEQTGSSTLDQYAVCNSSGVWLYSPADVWIVVWHPTADGQTTGRNLIGIAGCANGNTINLSTAWHMPPGTNLQYSMVYQTQENQWDPNGDAYSANYYDNSAGYRQFYARTGIDNYLLYARTVADWVFFSPHMNQGYLSDGVNPYATIDASRLGQWLRASDSPQIDMIPALRRALEGTGSEYYLVGAAVKYISDARGWGYNFASLAYEALMDSESESPVNLSMWSPAACPGTMTHRQCAANVMAMLVDPTRVDGWNYAYVQQNSAGDVAVNFGYGACMSPPGFWSCSTSGSPSSVTLTNGSTAIVFTGAMNCTTWAAGQDIWFWHGSPAVFPANPQFASSGSTGDSVYYNVASCSDAQHGTLDRVYAGATCNSGSPCGFETSINNPLGWANQTYMMGIWDRSIFFGATALAANSMSTAATNAVNVALKGAAWIKNNGFDPAHNSWAYFADAMDCAGSVSAQSPGPPPTQTRCTYATGTYPTSTALSYATDGALGPISNYLYNANATQKAVVDLWYNQSFANPALSCSAPCNTSLTTPTNWLMDIAPGTPLGDGYWDSFGNIYPYSKYFGQYFGFGAYATWPAIRLGGVAASASREIQIAFSLGSVPNATKVVVSVMGTDGSTTSTTCTMSPCQITIPRIDQPAYTIQLQYQSGTGVVLASSSLPVLESQ